MSGSRESNGYGESGHVLVALESQADQRLLVRTLTEAGLTVEPFVESAEPGSDADLVIVDPTTWRRSSGMLRATREREHPVVFPVLLLTTTTKEAGSEWIQDELGSGVDDLLQLPTSSSALRARVCNLLRLRRLSRTQANEHRVTKQALDGVSRALHTLHACNETMLREDSEQGLLESVCEIITQSEGYPLAWVGYVTDDDSDAARIAKQCIAGPAADYARAIDVRTDDSPEGLGPGGLAVATLKPQIVSNMATEPAMRPWQDQILASGLGAVIVLPLKVSNGPTGVLAVYSECTGDFETEERMLLERLADNLAFGIDRLRMQREQQNQSEEIRKLAYQDSLTGLPNRRSLIERLDHVVARAGREQVAAILFVDLNDFKLINDALGHAAGDAVLRSTAKRVQHTLRAGDLVARQGGDEFIVVMVDDPRHPPTVDDDPRARLSLAARSLSERIIVALQHPFDVQGHTHRLNASIGISLLPYLGDDAEAVLDQADMAMYFAKQSEQRIAFYSPDIGSHRRERLSLEEKIHYALEVGQFHLHYQPIWNLHTGEILAVEALLRWQDSEGQMISPGTFVPVAEEIGLLGSIGEWVIDEAGQQLEAWRQAGIEVFMSVNLTASQLQGAEAAQAIYDRVIALGSDPHWWVLELTEDTLMNSPQDVADAMNLLNAAGFRLALDDFGRGYSSLARLRSLPLHTLKIDKLFVDDLRGDAAASGHVVRGVIQLARQLSLRIVAEGIETAEQGRRLTSMKCDMGQGFLLSAAQPGDDIPPLVRASMGRALNVPGRRAPANGT